MLGIGAHISLGLVTAASESSNLFENADSAKQSRQSFLFR